MGPTHGGDLSADPIRRCRTTRGGVWDGARWCTASVVTAVAVLAATPSTIVAQQSRADSARSGAVVTGTVYDSIARVFLGGVVVQYVGADETTQSRAFSVRSDSGGRYLLTGVPPGRYLAGFFQTTTDTLGLETGARVVAVRPGEQRLDLATRSPKTVIASVCPPADPADSTGLIIGHVRNAETDAPVVGASVVIEWAETVIEGVDMRSRVARLTAQTHGPGWFAICGVPGDALLSARAAKDADSSGVVTVSVPADGVRHFTFLVGGATSVAVGPGASRSREDSVTGPPTVLRGRARLTGTIRDEKGRPVQDAHALIWGTDREAITNARGVFTLDSLPGGSHTLEVRAVRYEPVYSIVQLSPRLPATADVTVAQRAVTLSTVTVRGELVYSKRLASFEERRADGWGMVGHFMSPAEIERRPRTSLSGLLQGITGVFVDNRRGGATVRMRSTGDPNSSCIPSLYVDGTRDVVADFNAYYSDRIAGVEVYVRDTWRPSEFLDSNSCGAVAIWTRSAPVRKD